MSKFKRITTPQEPSEAPRIRRTSSTPNFSRPEPEAEPDWLLEPWRPEGGMLLAKTMQGLEAVLAQELTALGATDVKAVNRAVVFRGDKTLLYRANYELRTALRILVPLGSFDAKTEAEFYDQVQLTDWSQYMHADNTLSVDTIMHGTVFKHSHFMSLKCKDAIVDQFRERTGRRPSVDTINPHVRVSVHIRHGHCQLLLDSSGESLHLRGYRREQVAAPINEVLAAGMVLLSGWNGKGAFADPMCGSGTLPIEAALLARNIPPQQNRSNFGFQRWPSYDRKLWEKLVEEAYARIQPFEYPILASDISLRARNATAVNIMAAGLENSIHLEKRPFENLRKPAEIGTLIMNPPYDERLELDDVIAFYKQIGDRLKQEWSGWDAWIISANKEALKHVGLKASKKIPLLNGALECGFHRFELYRGKKYAEE